MQAGRRFAAALALLALAGCGGGVGFTYDLAVPFDIETVDGGTPAQILVREPRALKALDSERIIIRPEPTEITYLGDTQFADRLPVVVQAKVIEAFERSGGARAVGAPGDGLLIDYTVSLQIRRFEVAAYNSSVAEVELFVMLINERNGRAVASSVFRGSAPTSAEDPAQVAAGLNEAFGQVLKEIVRWTYQRI